LLDKADQTAQVDERRRRKWRRHERPHLFAAMAGCDEAAEPGALNWGHFAYISGGVM